MRMKPCIVIVLDTSREGGGEGATGGMRASQGTFFEFLIRGIIKLNKTSMASSGQEKNMCFWVHLQKN